MACCLSSVCNVFVWLQVMERALWHADNSYRIPHCVARGHLCRTNRPSSTAFRGFGAPQAMFVAETWVTDIADVLRVPPEQVGGLWARISHAIYLFIYLFTLYIYIYIFFVSFFLLYFFLIFFLMYFIYLMTHTTHFYYQLYRHEKYF